ncbi:S8 family serine peptidase [Psychrobacillus psychrodurans]|uniref:S8 family serine peptidase n=1 Tax=Psychrobacillus psychrodurans TaxID=126157 RepID=UPI001F4D6B02|nr:S8 family serine peptidase [Psychrobacillus psychrodurans]MCK1999105.1 S8 family serine peptidase [Psychrobacillus psychrodurans]
MKSKKKYIIYSLIVVTFCLVSTFIFFRTNTKIAKENNEIHNMQQWALLNAGLEVEGNKGIEGYDINALEAWNVTKGDPNILVGIVDTGIDISNPAIENSIIENSSEVANGIDDDENGYIDDINGWNFKDGNSEVYEKMTSDYHGTFIASLIAGKHSDTNEVWGVAPKVTIVPLKFMSGSSGSMDDVIEAVEYGYKLGVRIFNFSWDTTEYDEDLFHTIQKYEEAIFITSSGKGKYNVEEAPVYPCNFNLDNIVCVSAVDNSGELEKYSGYGLDLVPAPGVDVYGVLPEGLNTFSNGTSFATAYVTGIAALVKSIEPNIQSNVLANILKENKKTLSKDNSTVEIIDAKLVLENINSIQ